MKRHLGSILTMLLLSAPAASFAQTGQGDQYYDDEQPAPRVSRVAHLRNTSATLLPVPTDSPAQPGCAGGQCEPYYRDRPEGCKDKKRQTMLNNRTGEPNWYRHYRCNHFGYHPTTWSAWPDGWLTCRTEPTPGPHPYDLKHPLPKGGPTKRPTPPRSTTEPKTPDRPGTLDLPPPKLDVPKSSPAKSKS